MNLKRGFILWLFLSVINFKIFLPTSIMYYIYINKNQKYLLLRTFINLQVFIILLEFYHIKKNNKNTIYSFSYPYGIILSIQTPINDQNNKEHKILEKGMMGCIVTWSMSFIGIYILIQLVFRTCKSCSNWNANSLSL